MSLGSDGATLTMPVVPAGSACNTGNCGNTGFGGFDNNGAWWLIVLFLFIFAGGWGNRGWGGDNGGGGNSTPYIVANQGYDTRSDIQRGFDNQAVITKLDGITQGICDSTYALNNTMTNGFHGVDNAICSLGYNVQQGFNATQVAMMQGQNAIQTQLSNCCCGIEKGQMQIENTVGRGFCDTNYNLATQACDTRNTIQNTTRDIIDNQNANSRAILDALNQNYVRNLEKENSDLRMNSIIANSNAVNQAARDAQTAELLRRTGHDCPTAAYVVQPPTPVNFPTNCCGTFNGGWGNSCGNCGGCGC